ncbi:efflux transporter outer membrane subunit [Asaia krungthepensis]|uniref:RND efflux system outer membrane lipoprotein n=1 Tax=Asaia krungthepensis NRIC 0535 TaxID=1307925 RepID=A0ABQ0PXF3_9PROT|nr:efflux transporter outer membrane subunit [Asaia krungthepensis]GBQ83965.1 RND efflux system outer membrane lipoprotein [Asaia krungthepensis NRIC 0535]
MTGSGRILALLGTCTALSACTLGPDFRRPDIISPASYGPEPQDVAGLTYGGPVDVTWWKRFNDQELNSLIDRLAVQNIDLQRGMQRIAEARSQTRIAAAQGLPSLNWAGSYARTHQSETGFISLVQPRNGAPNEYDFFQNTLGASWDLDLFGQIRRAVEAQHASQEAAVEARHGLALSTLATLVDSYMQLRGVQDQIAITERHVAVADHDVVLVETRFGNGAATTLDLAQARTEQANTASALPVLRNSESALINAIGVLLDEPPRSLAVELAARDGTMPKIIPSAPVGLPSALARRRPDIREAEAKLHMATAGVGVAIAAFYPDITLTGQMGTQTLSAANFFSLPSRQFATGPTLSVPLFEGGRLRGTLALRKAEQKDAALAFHQTVTTAWNEVDNALTAYAQSQKRLEQTRIAWEESRKAIAIAREQYREGAVDFLQVDNAESAALAAEATYSANRIQIATAFVALYRALGGGWEYPALSGDNAAKRG